MLEELEVKIGIQQNLFIFSFVVNVVTELMKKHVVSHLQLCADDLFLFIVPGCALGCAMTPPLSTPLAPDNCRQIHMWRVRGFPLGSPPEGR